MRTFGSSSSDTAAGTIKETSLLAGAPEQKDGYQWTALSVTTVGALLASIQGSALLIALPSILAELHVTFFTIIWVLLGYLLILTVFTPIVGRLADMWGRKRLDNSGFISFIVVSLIAAVSHPHFHRPHLILRPVIPALYSPFLS